MPGVSISPITVSSLIVPAMQHAVTIRTSQPIVEDNDALHSEHEVFDTNIFIPHKRKHRPCNMANANCPWIAVMSMPSYKRKVSKRGCLQ